MQLDEDKLNELERRCDITLQQSTFKQQMEVMGDWLKVDVERLPTRAKLKFRRVLRAIARTTVLGPSE
jgi:predicted small secreted protein